MVDLLGPGDAGASPTLSTTSDVTSPAVGDTWFNDCPAGVVDASATPIVSKWLNWQMQQLRKAIRFSGVPLSNSYDNMLSWAIQSGKANWAYSAGGTANALTASVNNAPLEFETGTVIFLQATADNSGPTTLNMNDLGDAAVKDLGGNALVGGEIVSGNVVGFLRYPSSWRIITPPPMSWVLAHLSQIDVQTFDSSGTWTRPAGFADGSRVIVEMWGGGAGGTPTIGGCGGAYDRFETYLNLLPGSCSIVVGAGGTANNNTPGPPQDATAGGASYFAYGLYGNRYFAAGGPSIIAIVSDPTKPALPKFSSAYVGTGGNSNSGAYDSFYGGAAGAGNDGASVAYAPGTSIFGGNGGASGATYGAVGSAGSVPGGGGGAGMTPPSPVSGPAAYGGNGAHGRVRVTTIMG